MITTYSRSPVKRRNCTQYVSTSNHRLPVVQTIRYARGGGDPEIIF